MRSDNLVVGGTPALAVKKAEFAVDAAGSALDGMKKTRDDLEPVIKKATEVASEAAGMASEAASGAAKIARGTFDAAKKAIGVGNNEPTGPASGTTEPATSDTVGGDAYIENFPFEPQYPSYGDGNIDDYDEVNFRPDVGGEGSDLPSHIIDADHSEGQWKSNWEEWTGGNFAIVKTNRMAGFFAVLTVIIIGFILLAYYTENDDWVKYLGIGAVVTGLTATMHYVG